MGDADPDSNFRLRTAIDAAMSQNVPKDTIERAIRRASGADGSDNVEEIRYEGYGPGGVAIMVECMTDNRNRTVADVRHAFTKCGGQLGTDGSVSYLFTKVGQLSFPPGTNEERLMGAALDAGADDIVNNDDGSLDVITSPDSFMTVRATLQQSGLTPDSAEITMRAASTVTLDTESAETMVRLFDMLEDLDDVQKIYSNAEIPDAVLDRLNR